MNDRFLDRLQRLEFQPRACVLERLTLERLLINLIVDA